VALAWREETERQPGAWGCHRAVGEHWSSGAQPWHHSSRMDDHFSLDHPECRHRLNQAVGEHWRSGAYYSHLSLRLNAHICPAWVERRHRTDCTLPAPRRHSTQRRRRMPWADMTYQRPDPPWLDAHSRMALAGGWPIALWAIFCVPVTPCAPPHHTMPDQFNAAFGKHEEWAQVSNLTPPHSPCGPPPK
jgi:hypothetical protein